MAFKNEKWKIYVALVDISYLNRQTKIKEKNDNRKSIILLRKTMIDFEKWKLKTWMIILKI